MNLTFCNATAQYEAINEIPLWSNWTFHDLGLWLCAGFALFATLLSFYLMFQHATHYLKPWEQRHIIRILFMVPIYSVVSFLSYRFYLHSIYYQVVRDCYDAFAIASFFALLCHYVAPDLHAQKEYFRALKPKPWVLPLSWIQKCAGGPRGWARTPRSGLTWFNIIWLGVFQYCFIRVFCTIVAVGTQAAGRYCLASLSPLFAHIWVTCIEALGVTVAMYCLIQFYVQLRFDLADHHPFIKVLSIKLVIFLVFWQTIIINFLTSSNVIKTSAKVGEPDLVVGIPALLVCIEMACFSIMHLWAYPWKEYDLHRSQMVAAEGGPGLNYDGPQAYKGGVFGNRAYMDAFNPWDLVKAVARGFRWLFVGRRHRETDVSYKNNQDADPSSVPAPINKTSKYQPLNDNDSDVNIPYSQPQPYSQLNTRPFAQPTSQQYSQPITQSSVRSFSKPFNKASETDLGRVAAVDRSQEGWDDMRTVPPLPEQDTGYHGAQGPPAAYPGRQEWAADPRSHWGQSGIGDKDNII
ncbi:hypothetical protein MMC15_006441 [Xylographa vitiligo]|nr:hypothetical protein [Xylographa vitiligo]